MKENRYLCNWWNKKDSSEKVRFKFKMWLISFLIIFIPLASLLGLFSHPDYPEETFKELEKVYVPYVHEGVGVDVIGLAEKVTYLNDVDVRNGELTLKYGQDYCEVIVIMDENYNTLSVKWYPKTQLGYSMQYYISTLAMLIIIIIGVLFGENIILELFILLSRAHQWLFRKFHKKHKS